MSLEDFARKEAHLARHQGVSTAFRQAAYESFAKGVGYLRPDRPGRPIWNDDWDVALILDACRVDLFAEVATEYPFLPDDINTEYSTGSASVEWIANTFAPEHRDAYQRAGYVTANAFSGKDPGHRRPADVYPLRELPIGYLDEVWAEEWHTGDVETVLPETVTDRALWAYQHRNTLDIDRVAVHYMQPHAPFRTRPEWSDGWQGVDAFGTETDADKRSEWSKVRDGDIDRDELWAAYADNLRWGLDEVQRWVENTDADILVTSDHGNALGEWGMWGHPPGVDIDTVKEVPWVRVRGNNLADVEPELNHDPGITSGDTATETVDDRLEALGYR